MRKYTLEKSADLEQRHWRWDISIPRGAAVTVAGRPELGSWGTVAFTVRQLLGGVAYDFATPRTIPAGGGSVRIASAEMEACTVLRVKMAGDTVEGSAGTALISVDVEEPD